MIDYFFKFATEAAAIADASGSIYYTPAAGSNPPSWNPDRVVPGIQIWRNSLDTGIFPNIVHTMLIGWYGIISIDRVDNALLNHAALQVAIDREKSAAGQAGILRSNITNIVLQDLRFQPVFAGSNYPFGNLI